MAEYTYRLRNWVTGAVLSDVSAILYDDEGWYRVCRPAEWQGRINLQEPAAAPLAPLSTSLEVIRDGTTRFHGFTWRVHRKGDRNKATALCRWVDPMRVFLSRRVRDVNGKIGKPVFSTPITGGALLKQVMQNSEAWEGSPPPSPLPLLFGSDSTTVDLSFKHAAFPMKIAELGLRLASSGRCDHWVTPRVDLPGKLGELHCFDRAGTDRSAAVKLEYGTGLFNCSDAEHIADAETISTALSYWLGPKYDDEHWRGNVTKDDVNLPNPPQAAIAAAIAAARAAYGYWGDDRFFDDLADIGEPGVKDDDPLGGDRPGWRRLWQLEQSLRLAPRELLNLTPDPETIRPWDDFFLGDKVGAKADGLGLTVAGKQRVYGFRVKPGNEKVERVELMVSPQEAP